jgi:hypothetical protein
LVTASPIGSSTTTSSAIRASHPARSPAWTHRHDASEALTTGDCDVSVVVSDTDSPSSAKSNEYEREWPADALRLAGHSRMNLYLSASV